MHLPSRTTRSLLAGAVLSAAVIGLAPTPGAAAPTAEGTAALAWLADQLDDTPDGLFTGSFPDGMGGTIVFDDYGLTLDAVLALALGGGHGSTIDRSMDELESELPEYISHSDFGNGAGIYAGATAKVLLAEQVTGRPTTVGGTVLETQLRGAIRGATPTARWTGRVDAAHDDFSNGVTQALAVMALSRTTGGVPAAVRDFLLDQQCDNGGFRISFDKVNPDFSVDEAGSTRGCASNAQADLDASAFALQALLTVREEPGVPAALADLIAFMTSAGGAATNANHAGLYGQGLRAAGETAAADANAAKVLALRLPTGPDAGAIVLDADAKAAVPGGDIADDDLPFAWRATAQGVLALGLPPYAPAAAPPATTTTTAAATTSTTAAATTSTTAAAATSSTVAATTSTSAKAAGAQIPRTGSSSRTELLVGLFLVGLGLAAVGQSRLRGRQAP